MQSLKKIHAWAQMQDPLNCNKANKMEQPELYKRAQPKTTVRHLLTFLARVVIESMV